MNSDNQNPTNSVSPEEITDDWTIMEDNGVQLSDYKTSFDNCPKCGKVTITLKSSGRHICQGCGWSEEKLKVVTSYNMKKRYRKHHQDSEQLIRILITIFSLGLLFYMFSNSMIREAMFPFLESSNNNIPSSSSKSAITQESPSPKIVSSASLPPVCHQQYVKLTYEMFQNCFLEGMTYVQVANIIGYAGKQVSTSNSTEIWSWNGTNDSGYPAGSMSVVFYKDKLVSKSQVGLE